MEELATVLTLRKLERVAHENLYDDTNEFLAFVTPKEFSVKRSAATITAKEAYILISKYKKD